jgi:putative ATPase
MASEDIGLADPRALPMALDAAAAFERLGSPEGELMLAQAVVFLAVAPKSNAVYKAYQAVRSMVAADGTRPVPAHLRNAPTGLARQLGHGQGYRYAHDEPDGYAAGANYWPDGMARPTLYQPVERGLEIQIAARMRSLEQANQQAGGTPADEAPDRTATPPG